MLKQHKNNQWQIWIDRGGTFTDIIAKTPDGSLKSHKLLSENPEHYNDAAVQGIRELLGLNPQQSIPSEIIDVIKMGTTVATNALLERKGDRTLFLITKGFGDLLRIGYQNRPNIFALNIVLPELLYEEAVEVSERVSATGAVISPLNEACVRNSLDDAYRKGIRSVAIALMHGYRYPAHEKRIADLAREAGFTQISVSHEVSPLIKLVSRGDTTVVDAYLSPILRRYVTQIYDELGTNIDHRQSLMFMQSNGGLTGASLFSGKDAILSGPAGGVVGMVKTAIEAGHDRLIGFDMGGTSTDVSHFAGEYERSFETEVAGVRLRAPMMNIHTVAAGGGSILSFENGRFRVGPESAGASPGPASYRRGGPLTVTDCNVLLGKIQAEHFPCVFGPQGNEPLNLDIVRHKFTKMAQDIARKTGKKPMSPEKLAIGFLRVAVENMASAIKKISIQRGYDISTYTLVSFGGAGGQHACLVADALGMKKIFIHPFAGVLSALGMGLADIRAMREHQFEQALTSIDDAKTELERLSSETQAEVRSQGVDDNNIKIKQSVYLRYEDSHQSIPVSFGTSSAMQASFEKAHKARYGFIRDQGRLIIDILTSEAIGSTTVLQIGSLEENKDHSYSEQLVQMYSGDNWARVPLIEREKLGCNKIVGPAIIAEATGTNIIEPGWTAGLDQYGNLILSRENQSEIIETVNTQVDPVMLEVFNSLFMSIAEQMGATLANTAYSVNIKERLDFSCAIFDLEANLVANAPHVPVHLGSMSESVRSVIKQNIGHLNPGDVYMMNNPFNGGTHLPDVTVITPVFDESESKIIFFVASRGHHADIGGKTPGSAPPDSCHIDEEGIVIDNFKLVKDGSFCESQARELLSSGSYPCRNIDQNIADLSAQVAANETGVMELKKMVQKFGLNVVHAYMGHVQDNAEESVRQAIDELKNSSFCYQLDNGSKIKVEIKVNQKNRSVKVDFSGTSHQDKGNYNAPFSICRAAVIYVFRTLVSSDIPLNEGCMRPISLIVPEGSLINPIYPAAVIAGNTEVSQAITETLYGALGILAGSQGTMNNLLYGNEVYQNYETICGGVGAGPSFNGASAVHSHMTNTRMTDPEVLESRFPVRVEEFSIRRSSGGAGKFCGGDGVVRKILFLEEQIVTVLSSHRKTRPFGVKGGGPGKRGVNSVIRADGAVETLNGNDSRILNRGDIFVMKTPGGGGFAVK